MKHPQPETALRHDHTMKPITLLWSLGAILFTTSATVGTGADDVPAPAAPPGRPTREELRERIRNLTPEERQARLREFREKQAQSPGASGREAFEKRRQERETLLNEIKNLPPAERQAKLREFRERGGLTRPGFRTLNPEERDAKRKQFQERVAKEIATLRAKKARGGLDEDGERSLQRMEMIAKRLEQGSLPVPGALPLPIEKPAKPPGNP